MKKNSITILVLTFIFIINSMMSVFANNYLGGNQDGFYYGLQRAISVLSHKGKYSIILENYVKISDTQFEIQFTSPDRKWLNGKFIVDIYPVSEENKKVRKGYQAWFGYYDENQKMIGCGQIRKQ